MQRLNKKCFKKKWKKDVVFNSFWFIKWINSMLLRGNKKKLEIKMYSFAYRIQILYSLNFIYILFELFELLKPLMLIESGRYTKRIGRKLSERLKIPAPINYWSQYLVLIHWIIKLFNNKNKNCTCLTERLKIILTFHKSIKIKKDVLNKDLIQNRMFLHFRWYL